MSRLEQFSSDALFESINTKGFGLLQKALSEKECSDLIDLYPQSDHFRKTINMERYRFGQGQYRYFQNPLPVLISQLRSELYQILHPLANRWATALKLPMVYPNSYSDFLAVCAEHGQHLPTPLILKYEAGGHNTLHQDLYGDVYFPMQAICCLSEPGKDFEGGSIVLTEQTPRAQSKAIVINPQQGDLVIVPTRFRPKLGSRGYYRLNMKHGVCEVTQGIRYTLGVILHNAQ